MGRIHARNRHAAIRCRDLSSSRRCFMEKKTIIFEAEGETLEQARENVAIQLARNKRIEILEAYSQPEREPEEKTCRIHAQTKEEAIEQLKEKIDSSFDVKEVLQHKEARKGFLGLFKRPRVYKVRIYKRNNALVRIEGSKTKRRKGQWYCSECGSVQFDREWEKMMDRRAKAMGSRGFVNISARPRCLQCNSESLIGICNGLEYVKDQCDERNEIREFRTTNEYTKLMELSMQIEFPATDEQERAIIRRLKTIGRKLNKKGGSHLMYIAIKAMPSSSRHDNLWRDFIDASWSMC